MVSVLAATNRMEALLYSVRRTLLRGKICILNKKVESKPSVMSRVRLRLGNLGLKLDRKNSQNKIGYTKTAWKT